MSTKPSLGIGILSWRAHDTLQASLRSYAGHGLLDLFDKRLIYFSDISETDKAIAEAFGWAYAGGKNAGIAGGMEALARALDTDYVLLLQNDNPVVVGLDFAEKHLQEAIALLESGKADLVRMRHRWQVGESFACARKYLRYFPAVQPDPHFLPSEHGLAPQAFPDTLSKRVRRLLRPVKAARLHGRSIFVEAFPEKLYPEHIQRSGDFLIVDSSILHFTDQCLLVRRTFFLDVLMDYTNKHPSSRRPNGFQAPEICINGPWWRKKHYKIAQGEGLFTHDRKDGSFRPEHHAFEVSSGH